ncbi:MAG: hypothetical protein ACREA9_26585 [Pyrinomonadaceae bacterium]
MRQYEIHLPLKHSEGVAIEEEKIKRVRQEVFAAFGCWAVPYGRARRYDGVEYVDIIKIEFMTSCERVTKKRLGDFIQRLKESLQEIDNPNYFSPHSSH